MATVAGLLCLGINGPRHALAQGPLVLAPPAEGKVQRLTLRDGTQIIGKIVAVTDSSVQFESAIGTTTILRSMISRIREETPGVVHDGVYYFPSPNTTRLFFAPTGRTLAKGDGYFADHWLFFPSISWGVSNNFTFGGGISFLPGLSPTDQLWYVTPKFGLIQGPTLNVSIGALAGSVPRDFDTSLSTFGLLYGVATFGGPDASFTTGLTYGFAGGEVARRPALMLGGESRAAPRVSFVTENYLFPGGMGMFSGGLRLFGTNTSFDVGAMAFTGGGEPFCCLPWLGVVWKF
jgi:hypothetical protein